MGLFDFLKPKKKPLAQLLQEPGVRSAMAGMELEYLQKQISNFQSVGRDEDAKKALADFLERYVKDAKCEVASRLDLARISYSLAYRTLPNLVHERWAEFCDLWGGGIPFPMFLAIKGASESGKRLGLAQIQEFKYYQGALDSSSEYFLIEFPTPPDQGEGPSIESLMAALSAGKELSRDLVPVLGPYFVAIVIDSAKNEKYLYILGQSPGGGTTLRFVAAGGMNANCGPGPTPPESSAFLQAIKTDLRRR
jgi:hypothetical protein